MVFEALLLLNSRKVEKNQEQISKSKRLKGRKCTRLSLMFLKATAADPGAMRINGSGSSPSGVSGIQIKKNFFFPREMESSKSF